MEIYSYMITPFHLLERYGKYSMIQNGSTGFIVQLIAFVKRARTSTWTVLDVYEKVWLTRVSPADSLQICNIFCTPLKWITAAVTFTKDPFCIVNILKVLYLNTQKPLSAGNLHKSHPNEKLIFYNEHTHRSTPSFTYMYTYYKKTEIEQT